jgi:hypothetical protein
MNVKKCKQYKHHQLADRINCKTTFRLRRNPTVTWCMKNDRVARYVDATMYHFEMGDTNA